MAVNLNTWSRAVTLKEGKKLNLTIAQVKEVMKIILNDMKAMTIKDITELLARLKK